MEMKRSRENAREELGRQARFRNAGSGEAQQLKPMTPEGKVKQTAGLDELVGKLMFNGG